LVGFGELPLSILDLLAEQVGILHRSRTQLEFEHPFSDQFDIVFEHDLLKSFDTLVTLPESASQGQQSLRDTISPHKDQITSSLKHLKELQSYAKSLNKPQVICHTDLHGGNLMTDDQNNLYILDWENALIAPLEHDMIFFAKEEGFFEVFWPIYTCHFPSACIDFDMLRFYFYRRSLEDIADFILRILRRDGSKERDQQDIKWMIECLDDLEQIESIISPLEEGSVLS